MLAHSLSVIVVQSAAADDVFDQRPEAARAALKAIEGAGRTALADLRRVLDGVHALEPQPSLARLDGLAEAVRAPGWPSTSTSTARPPTCRRSSTSPAIGSCRRR